MKNKIFDLKIEDNVIKLHNTTGDAKLAHSFNCLGVKSAAVNGRWVIALCNDNEEECIYEIDINEPILSTLITILACISILGSLIAVYYTDWTTFIACSASGLILFGFSRIIDYLYQATQRLRDIDFHLLQNNNILLKGKVCPYCAESIKPQAIMCRYCGKDVA